MTKLLLMLLLLPVVLNASDLLAKIEKIAAEKSSCSVQMPCEITIEQSGNYYIAKVKRSVKITEDGVLKYKTGSTSYHKFNENGAYIGTKHTT